jgi:hypothetical protein
MVAQNQIDETRSRAVVIREPETHRLVLRLAGPFLAGKSICVIGAGSPSIRVLQIAYKGGTKHF